jgi:hypothetical protein
LSVLSSSTLTLDLLVGNPDDGPGLQRHGVNLLLLKNIGVAGLNWGTYLGWSPGDGRAAQTVSDEAAHGASSTRPSVQVVQARHLALLELLLLTLVAVGAQTIPLLLLLVVLAVAVQVVLSL